MALGQTFDLASIYGAAEGLKEQRTRNELLDQQVGMQTLMRDTAKAAVGPDGQYDPITHAKTLAQSGYPQVGQQILGEMMDHTEKANKYLMAMLPRMTPESYPGIKAQMERAGIIRPGQFPEQFDQKAIMSQYAMLQGLNGKLTGAMEELYRDDAGNTVVGTRNPWTGEPSNIQKFSAPKPHKPGRPMPVENEDGSVVYVDPSQALGKRAPKPASAQPKPFRFTASDTNAIYRQAAGLFGGMYDPVSGQMTITDPTLVEKAQHVAARASQIYRESAGDTDHATAVEQALQEANAPAPRGPSPAGGPQSQQPRPGSIVKRKADGAQFRVNADGSLAPL